MVSATTQPPAASQAFFQISPVTIRNTPARRAATRLADIPWQSGVGAMRAGAAHTPGRHVLRRSGLGERSRAARARSQRTRALPHSRALKVTISPIVRACRPNCDSRSVGCWPRDRLGFGRLCDFASTWAEMQEVADHCRVIATGTSTVKRERLVVWVIT